MSRPTKYANSGSFANTVFTIIGNSDACQSWLLSRQVRRALATVKDVDTLIVGHSPLRKVPELKEYQQFMTDFVAAVKQAKTAGKSVDDATASIDLSAKYKDYKKERYKVAIQAIYDELK